MNYENGYTRKEVREAMKENKKTDDREEEEKTTRDYGCFYTDVYIRSTST